jgi:hypothetical protein
VSSDPYFRRAGGCAGALRTTAVLDATSTAQTIPSPGPRPRIVATVCGTVVLTDPDPGTARNTLDSNSSTIDSAEAPEDLKIGL